MGILVRFPHHARASAGAGSESETNGPVQSSAVTAPSVNALIASIASQSGRTSRLRQRLTETRFRPTAAATTSSDSSRSDMKSDKCMSANVHPAHIWRQAECTPGVIPSVPTQVHPVYMPRNVKLKATGSPPREPTWRRTNMVHWRKHSRLTQEAVAAAVEASYVTVGRWERGEVPPDANALETLARLYGTDIHSMLNRLPPISDQK